MGVCGREPFRDVSNAARSARVPGLPGYFIVFVASMVAIGPFAIDTYLPAMPTMAQSLNVDIVSINSTLSAYLFGFAFGQLFGGPISDQIGRRPVGMLGLIVFSGSSLFIAAADSMSALLALRAVQAVGGGFATVICMAMVRDAYPPMEAAKRFPVVMLVMLGAPLVAPAIGAALLSFGWQSIFVFLAVYAVVVLVAFLRVPETATMASGKLQLGRILPQYIEVLTTRVDGKHIPIRYIFSQGLMMSGIFVFITNASFIYLQYFDIDENWFVVFFGINILTMMVFTLGTARLIHRIAPYQIWRAGRLLQFMAIVLLAVSVSLFELPLWAFAALLAIAIGAGGMINPSVTGLYLAHFDRLSGSAVSLMNVVVFLFGSVLGIVTGLFHDGSLKPIIYTMVLASTVGNLIALYIPAPKGFDPNADGIDEQHTPIEADSKLS
jgi:DHA1 family bicyclomycin/chloramphenicol resistance-like MFS transporter